MNKRKMLIAAAALVLVGVIVAAFVIFWGDPGKPTHMILNKDRSYGGSLNEELYGKGVPKNGQYDVEDSAYYTVNNDYYNMPSTEERIILPYFASYQQTMQDSSGLACMVMALNYMGKKYTELDLLEQYEAINGETVYGKGTTETGLMKLFNSLGLDATISDQDPDYRAFSEDTVAQFFMDSLKAGKLILVRYTSPVGYEWKVVIGYDTLGNIKNTQTEQEMERFGDDVIIFAEPHDGYDHRQDGYATERAKDFFAWWCKMESTGVVSERQSFLIVDPGKEIAFDIQPVDETPKQTVYENHLPKNPDGSFGGTRDKDLYGSIISGRGWWDHLESNYYKVNDFYNMGSEGTRILLPNYTVLQQTMSSSCGVCAVNSVLSYYGAEDDPYEMEESYVKLYEALNNLVIKGSGSSPRYHKVTLENMGYTCTPFGSKPGEEPDFASYEDYISFIRENLLADMPVVVSTYLGSGHFLTVIGLDDMGTDYIYDDVVITADSCDYWDGHQDGYNVFSAYKFYAQHTNSVRSTRFAGLTIDKPAA